MKKDLKFCIGGLLFIFCFLLSCPVVGAVSVTDVFKVGEDISSDNVIYFDKEGNAILINVADYNYCRGPYKFGVNLSKDSADYGTFESGIYKDCVFYSFESDSFGESDIESYRYLGGSTSVRNILNVESFTFSEEATSFLEKYYYRYFHIYQKISDDEALFSSPSPIVKGEESELEVSVNSYDIIEAVQFKIDEKLINVKDVVLSEGWKYEYDNGVYYLFNDDLKVTSGKIATLKIVASDDLKENDLIVPMYKSIKAYTAYYPSKTELCYCGTECNSYYTSNYDASNKFVFNYDAYVTEKTDIYVGFNKYYYQNGFDRISKEGYGLTYESGSSCGSNNIGTTYSFHLMRLVSEEYKIKLDVAQKIEDYIEPSEDIKGNDNGNPNTGLKENAMLIIFSVSFIITFSLFCLRKKVK